MNPPIRMLDLFQRMRWSYPSHVYCIAYTTLPDVSNMRGKLTGFFPVDAHALGELLSSPWLSAHMEQRDTLLFAFQRAADFKAFGKKFRKFSRAGYRVVKPEELSPDVPLSDFATEAPIAA